VREHRKKIWIHRFQTLLVFRMAFFCLSFLVAIGTLIMLEISTFNLIGGDRTFRICISATLVFSLSLLYLYDMVKFAHRIVGPLHRIRKTVQAIIAGDRVDLIRLRDGDYFGELADELNIMLKLLEERGAVELNNDADAGQKKEPLNMQQKPNATMTGSSL
jgi:hypothetical protein